MPRVRGCIGDRQNVKIFSFTACGRSLVTLLILAASNHGADAPRSPAAVTGLAYHPDGQFLVAADYGRVVFIDAKTGEPLREQPVMPGPISALAVTANRLAVT